MVFHFMVVSYEPIEYDMKYKYIYCFEISRITWIYLF